MEVDGYKCAFVFQMITKVLCRRRQLGKSNPVDCWLFHFPQILMKLLASPVELLVRKWGAAGRPAPSEALFLSSAFLAFPSSNTVRLAFANLLMSCAPAQADAPFQTAAQIILSREQNPSSLKAYGMRHFSCILNLSSLTSSQGPPFT